MNDVIEEIYLIQTALSCLRPGDVSWNTLNELRRVLAKRLADFHIRCIVKKIKPDEGMAVLNALAPHVESAIQECAKQSTEEIEGLNNGKQMERKR